MQKFPHSIFLDKEADYRCTRKGLLTAMITVTAGVLLKKGKVFIGRRKASARLPGKWEFPGGKLEVGETPQDCLRRELKEELRIETAVGDFLWEGVHRYDFGIVRLLVYRVYWDGSRILSKDHDEVAWALPENLLKYDFAPADRPFVEKLANGGLASV